MPFDITGEYAIVSDLPSDSISALPVLGFIVACLITLTMVCSFLLSATDPLGNELNFLSNTLASNNLGIPVSIILPLESTSDKFSEESGDSWVSKNLVKVSELIPAKTAPLNSSFVLFLFMVLL